MELSYDEIRRIHRLEKSTSRLVELEPAFYTDLSEFISREKAIYMQSLKEFSVAKTRNFTNLKKMVEEIFAMRGKKILSRALAASRTNEALEENLTAPEKKFYKNILAELNAHNRLLEQLFSSDSGRPAGGERAIDALSVKMLSDIPPFVGADMKDYGPFAKEQVVELPGKVAKLLISKKLGAADE